MKMHNKPKSAINDLSGTGLEVGDEVEALLWLFDSGKHHLRSLWSIINEWDNMFDEKVMGRENDRGICVCVKLSSSSSCLPMTATRFAGPLSTGPWDNTPILVSVVGASVMAELGVELRDCYHVDSIRGPASHEE